jgi:hypothetical protein
MTNKIIIWWSTWDFYRISNERNTDEEILKKFIWNDISAVEINIYKKENLEWAISRNTIETNFSYCSIHAPVYAYQNDEESHKILKYIENLCSELPIKNIVVHPDLVGDFAFFDQYKHLPLSIENMDNAKLSYKWVNDFQKVFESNPYLNFTLDLQHCFVNDPSMQLAKDFHNAFWDRLVEYHISWHHPEHLHHPLYQTQQNQIIQALEKLNLPIIIESGFDEDDWLEKEIQYISNTKSF